MALAFRLLLFASSVAVCLASCPSRTLITNRTSGSISTWNSRTKYQGLINCEWFIAAPSNHSFISLRVEQFETECSFDFVYLFDGCEGRNRRKLAALSGDLESLSQREFVATSGCMHVHFVSDMDYTRSGFRLSFTTGACPAACGAKPCNGSTGACRCPTSLRGADCSVPALTSCPASVGRLDASGQQCECKTGRAGFNCSLAVTSVAENVPSSWHDLRDGGSSALFSARAHFAMAQSGGATFVHGGRNLDSSLSDLLRFAPDAWPAWTRLDAGSGPSRRHGHVMWTMGGNVFVHGGIDLAGRQVFSDLWRFSTSAGTWQRLAVIGEAPRLYFHTATAVGNSVYLIGGQTDTGAISDGSYSLSLTSASATGASCGRLRPRHGAAPRVTGHTAIYHPRRQAIVVFGGFVHNNDRQLGLRTNRVHLFSLPDVVWTPLLAPTESSAPQPRAFHTASLMGEDYMVVKGGSVHIRDHKEICKDGGAGKVYYYHLGCHQWLSVPSSGPSGAVPSFGRFGHGAAVLRGNILVQLGGFGGHVMDRLDAFVVPSIVARATDSLVSQDQHCASLLQCTSDPACAVCNVNGREQCVPISNSTASCKRHSCPGLCPLLTTCFDCLSFASASHFFSRKCSWCSVAASCHLADKPSPPECSKVTDVSWWKTPEKISDREKCITAFPAAGAYLNYYLPPINYTQPDYVVFLRTFNNFEIPSVLQWSVNVSTDSYIHQPGQTFEVRVVTTIAPLLNVTYYGRTTGVSYPFQLQSTREHFNVSMYLSTDEDPAHKALMRQTEQQSPPNLFLRFGLPQPFPHGRATYWMALHFKAAYTAVTVRAKQSVLVTWAFENTGFKVIDSGFLRQVRRPSGCEALASCAACAANAACGWCRSAGACQQRWGDRRVHCLSPVEEVVTSVAHCPNCTYHLSCLPCAHDPLCEWFPPASLCLRRGRFPNTSVASAATCPASCVALPNCSACMARKDCAWCDTSSRCYPFAWQVWNLLADCVSWRHGVKAECPLPCTNASASCWSCLGRQGCAWRYNASATHVGSCEAWPGPANVSSNSSSSGGGSGEMVAYAECPLVDECALGLATKCKANSTCVDLRQGYRCQCDPGFEGDGEVGCNRTCHPACVHGRCSGPPEFRCSCQLGYTGTNCSQDCGCNRHANCSRGVGLCDTCYNGTTGSNCERCLVGHHGNASLAAGCALCSCHGHGTPPQLCDPSSGKCFCRHNTEGDSCERCQPGFDGQPTKVGEFCFAVCAGRRHIRNLTAGLTDFVGWPGSRSTSTSVAHCDWLLEAGGNSSAADLIVARVHRLTNVTCSRGALFLHAGIVTTSRPLPDSPAAAAALQLLGVACDRVQGQEFESRSGRLHLHFLLETVEAGRPEFVLKYSLLRCPDCGLGRVCRWGRCECPAGRHGTECNFSDCPANCTPPNGVCKDGACRCDPQWTAADCSKPVHGPTVSLMNQNLSALFAHSVVTCGNVTLLFGGEAASGLASNELFRLSDDELLWEPLPCVLSALPLRECPPRMAWHAAVCDEDAAGGPAMLVVGPSDGAIWRYAVSAGRWSRVPLPWTLDGGFLGHSLTLAEAADGRRRVYLVGGMVRSSASKQWDWNEDVWVLNASATGHLVARRFETLGQSPGGLYGHTTGTGSNTKDMLFVIGGYHSSRVIREGISLLPGSTEIDSTPTVSSDVYALQLSSGKWYLMPTPRSVGAPQPHGFAAAVKVGHSQVLVHGGIGADGKPLADDGVHVYDLLCNAWSKARINWSGVSLRVREKAMSYAGALVKSLRKDGRFLLVGGALAGIGSPLTLAFEHLSGPPHGLSHRSETVPCSGAAASVQDCGQHASCRHCRAAATPLPTLAASGGPPGVAHRSCVWCGTCFPGEPACRNGSSCGSSCSVQVGPGVACAGEESCGDAAACDSCRKRWPHCEWSRRRDLCVDVRSPSASQEKASCLQEGCHPGADCRACLVTAMSPCAHAPHRLATERCLKSAALPLSCAGGRCGAVFEHACPLWELCANVSVCAKCLVLPGCGWVPLNPSSLDGRGVCRPGGFAGPQGCDWTSREKDPSAALLACRSPASHWAFAVCPAENECANGHHTCDATVQDCVDTPSGFQCPCKPGYKLQEGRCRPQCPRGCVSKQGVCVLPDVCKCEFGFTGPDCSTACDCNGHSECRGPGREERADCLNCTHNTVGKHCEMCQHNFVGDPQNGGHCQPCVEFCNGHSNTCRRVPTIFKYTVPISGPKKSEATCAPCANNTVGARCSQCQKGFYRTERDPRRACLRCNCNGHDWQCDAGTGLNCNCQNNTKTPEKCLDKGKLNAGGTASLAGCIASQCSTCKDYFHGRPTEGRQCYRTMSMEHQYCFDFFSDQAQCGLNPSKPLPVGKTVFFVVQPKYMNVDIRVVVDMREGEVDVYVSSDNRRFIVAIDPHTWDHRVTVSTKSEASAAAAQSSSEAVRRRRRRSAESDEVGVDPVLASLSDVRVLNASRIITHARLEPDNVVMLVRRVSTRLVLFISRSEHNLKSSRFYLIFRGASRAGAQGKVLFRQDQVHIDLFVFFSVFFACFFLLLGAFIVGWKCKQVMDFRRNLEREAKARQTMASRPFATVYVALDRRPLLQEAAGEEAAARPDDGEPTRPPASPRDLPEAEFSPVPVAVEPTDDGIACVGTLLMQLPGPVVSLGSGLMTMRVMYPSGKQSGAAARRRASLSNC